MKKLWFIVIPFMLAASLYFVVKFVMDAIIEMDEPE